jgi:hypothetical protein
MNYQGPLYLLISCLSSKEWNDSWEMEMVPLQVNRGFTRQQDVMVVVENRLILLLSMRGS